MSVETLRITRYTCDSCGKQVEIPGMMNKREMERYTPVDWSRRNRWSAARDILIVHACSKICDEKLRDTTWEKFTVNGELR